MKDTEAEHGMDSGTATEAVVRQVGMHQHQLANRCSLGENSKDRGTGEQGEGHRIEARTDGQGHRDGGTIDRRRERDRGTVTG